RGEELFQPIFGNGHVWELGVGLAGHADLMRRGYHLLSIYFNGALTTQFSHFQTRSFDLIGRGPLSRYLLMKEFDAATQYDASLVNAIDFSTRATRVGRSVVFDGYVKAVYYYDRAGFEIGYNCYARSSEKLRIQDDLFPSDLNNRQFGIKGTEGVCYRIVDSATGTFTGETGRLDSTQHRATIVSAAPTDNPCAIALPVGQEAVAWNSTTIPGGMIAAVQSCPPIILDIDALDITTGASPRQLTHKFFAHVSYTALNRVWEPQIGCGAMIEIDGRPELISALNQWGFWVKGTISF
ncbi:hypothetical protein H0W26_03100, partial [Candidatus Dependentiae bacterium]|nr:hypothetical protein [Candidatus Dependentiae bacterium]